MMRHTSGAAPRAVTGRRRKFSSAGFSYRIKPEAKIMSLNKRGLKDLGLAKLGILVAAFFIITGLGFSPAPAGNSVKLLNVSYDPTREFYQEFNQAFAAHWKKKTGQVVTINQSH